MCPTLASTTYPEPRYPAILFAFVGDSTITSGLPPGTAVFRRAGTFGPPSVASVLSLPVWLVFVGTVLLSVVRGAAAGRAAVRGLPVDRGRDVAGRGSTRVPPTPAGAAAENAPSAGHGKPRPRIGAEDDPRWARRHPDQRRPRPGVPGLTPSAKFRPPPPPSRRGSDGRGRSTPSAPRTGRPGVRWSRRRPPTSCVPRTRW